MNIITVDVDVISTIIGFIITFWILTIVLVKSHYYDIHLKLEDYKELKKENEELKRAIELIKEK